MPLGQWTTENKIRLIQEFKKHSKLWDTENDDFIKSPVVRSHEIAKITEAINKHEAKNYFTHDQIRFQIGFLKGEYLRRRKLLKKSQKRSTDAAKEPNWVFYQHLKFLDYAEDSTKPATKVSPLLDENFCKISDANTVLPSGSALRRLRQTKVACYKLKNAKRATTKPASSNFKLTTTTPKSTLTLGKQPSPPSSAESSSSQKDRKRKLSDAAKIPSLNEGVKNFDGFGAYVETTLKRISNYSSEVAQRVRNEMKILLYKSEVEAIGLFHDHSQQ